MLLAPLAASNARSDGFRTPNWARMFKDPDKCCSAHSFGDPVVISSSVPYSAQWEIDLSVATPRGNFVMTRGYVGDARVLGQTHQLSTEEACVRPVVGNRYPGLLKAPYGDNFVGTGAGYTNAQLSINSLTSIVDTRCSTHTRVLTPNGDTRFFAPSPALNFGEQAWVPRASDGQGEPSRLRVSRGSSAAGGHLTFEWFHEDGRRLVYETLFSSTGPNGQYRLKAEYRADGLLFYTITNEYPVVVPGQGGSASNVLGGTKRYTWYSASGGNCACPSGQTCTLPNGCSSALPVCHATQGCIAACPSDMALCDGRCREKFVDPTNCGGCGTTCDVGQYCRLGACTPDPLSCMASIEPSRVVFPDTALVLEFIYRNPPPHITNQTEWSVSDCVLDRVEAINGANREILVSYDYETYPTVGVFATAGLKRTLFVPDGGVNGWTHVQTVGAGDRSWSNGLLANRPLEIPQAAASLEHKSTHTWVSPGSSLPQQLTLRDDTSPISISARVTDRIESTCANCCTAAQQTYGRLVSVRPYSQTYWQDAYGKNVSMLYFGSAEGASGQLGKPLPGWQSIFGPLPESNTQVCTGSSGLAATYSCESGTRSYIYGQSGGNSSPPVPNACGTPSRPVVPIAVQARNGSFSHVTTRLNSTNAAFESIRSSEGADDALGSNALQTADRTFEYPNAGQQVQRSELRPSVLAAAEQTSIIYVRDNEGRVERAVRQGYTRNGDDTNVKTFIATFYRTGARLCSGLSEPPGSQRIAAIDGPCLVAGIHSTECSPFDSGGGIHVPVVEQVSTEIFYYGEGPAPEPLLQAPTDHFNHGRVAMIRRYTRDCTGPIDTFFGSYSASGTPGIVKGPNAEITSLTRAGELVLSLVTPDSQVYGFEWDRGRVSRVTRPEGDSTVFCTQATGVAPVDPQCLRQEDGLYCVNGICSPVPTYPAKLGDKTAWRADVGKAPGRVTLRSEHFTYDREALASRSLVDPSGIFLETRLSNDVDSRVSKVQFGSGQAGWFSSLRFDSVSSLVGRGNGFDFVQGSIPTDVEPHCIDGNVDDPRCVYFERDRLGRLVSTRWNAAGVQDCLGYDAHGNVSVVAQGCPSVASCPTNVLTTVQSEAVVGGPTCGTARREYIWDDFGRLVSSRTRIDGTWSEVRTSYYPSGAPVRKQTQTQSQQPKEALWTARDSANRLTKVGIRRDDTGDWVTLNQYIWDDAPPRPTGCDVSGVPASNSSRHLQGRIGHATNPVWDTWYSYDLMGRITVEQRVVPDSAGVDACAVGDNRATNSTQYSYRPNGNVEQITYPFGRKVIYQYPSDGESDNNLPNAVLVDITQGEQTIPVPLLTDIKWTADKRLRSYTFTNIAGLHPSTHQPIVSYQNQVMYDYGVEGMHLRPSKCDSEEFAEWTPTDASGRLRRIRVREIKDGEPGPFVYERWFTWAADQIAAVDVCYQGMGRPLSEFLAPLEGPLPPFDQQQRLTLNQPSDQINGVVAEMRKQYGYDELGNRLAEWLVDSGGGWKSTIGEGSVLKRVEPIDPASGPPSVTVLANNRGYYSSKFDYDGRPLWRKAATDSTGLPNSILKYSFPDSVAANGGTESVLRTFEVGSLPYNYFYDGQNKRIRKVYPNQATEDFFYDQSKRLISERSFRGLDEQDGFTIDEYVYLAGVPVLSLRSLFSSEFVRLNDINPSGGGCHRRNVEGPCGVVQLISDHHGTPVLAMDNGAYTTGVGEYDAFGFRNRVRLPGRETAHPMSGAAEESLGTIGRTKVGDLIVQTRARVSFFDAAWNPVIGFSGIPRVEARNGVTSSVAGGELPFMVTEYLTGDFSNVFFVREDSSGDGAVLDSFEYERVTDGVYARYFPPLRFPGQYYDEESDLHENHNRYYDPGGGRYLSPEPLLQSPAYVRRTAQAGMSVPTYAYAANNPLKYVDRDGRIVTLGSSASWRTLDALAALMSTSKGRFLFDALERSPHTFELQDVPLVGRTYAWTRGDLAKPNGKIGGCTTYTIPIQFDWAQFTGFARLNRRLNYTDMGLVAHEFGHALGYIPLEISGDLAWPDTFAPTSEREEARAEYWQDAVDGMPGRVRP
jgi:RHS repeat-associated protein